MPKLVLSRSQLQHKELLFAFLNQISQSGHGVTAPLSRFTEFDDWRLVKINRTLPHNAEGKPQAPIGVQFMEDDITIAQKIEPPGSDMPQIFTFSWRRAKCIYLSGTDPVQFLED